MYRRTWTSPLAGGVGRPGFVAEHDLWDARQAEAATLVAAELDQVDLVHVAFGDPHGLVRSKTLTTQAFRAVLRNGMDFSPGPFLFDSGHAVAVDFRSDPGVGVPELVGAGDFVLVPDPTTFQLLPGEGPRRAWVLGDEYLRGGRPHPLSGRHALRRLCARYAAERLRPVVGLEVEWYLTRRLDGPVGNTGNGFGLQGEAPRTVAVNGGYQFNLDTLYDTVAPVADPLAMRLLDLGLPLRSMEHESGPGQVETTFDPLDALDAADAMLLFRTVAKQFCARRGYHASFMSLPLLDGSDPSGWHLHQSVVDTATGRNLFAAPRAEGLSATGNAYLDGLLVRARDLCLPSVPTVNGYHRLGPVFSLAPTRIDWSFEDRTAMVRVLGGDESTHLENRVGEPSANPYLAITAQLWAGLDGIRARTAETAAGTGGPPTARGTAVLPDHLPLSLDESLEVFATSGCTAEVFGEPLAGCLVKLKGSEVRRFEEWRAKEQPPDGVVTAWEQREYFDAF